jgi:predicted O-methyltransferase YrrM
MDFLPEDLTKYSTDHTTPESPLLARVNRETHVKVLQPRMLSGHLQGRILAQFSHMIRPKRILEIGTYTGYSALCMAEGLAPDGLLFTIDINEELEDLVRGYFSESLWNEKIRYIIGDAKTEIANLDETWDLVFIDADKPAYKQYFDLVIDNVREGGFIIVDNVLWSGKIVNENADRKTAIMQDFNDAVHEDPRVENVLVPVRDGLMVIRKL